MASVPVNINQNIIEWVLQKSSNVKNSNVLDYLLSWRNGDKTPTFKQIEDVSRATHVPLGYFFLNKPPVEEIPVLQFRTVDSIEAGELSREAIDTYNHMESIQRWMRDYMIDAGYDKLSFIGSLKEDKDVSALAREFREILQIPINWHDNTTTKKDAFKYFRERLENIGILVMVNGIVGSNTHRALNIEEFRAFTLIDDYAPLVFINANDSDGAKLFSLLHETAHVFLGVNNFYNDRYGYANGVNTTETLSNALAAEVLVPNNLFNNEWKKQSSANDFKRKLQLLSGTFKCGTVVIARKALDNRYINRDQYKSVVDEAVAKFKYSRTKSTGGDYYLTSAIRIDNRFLLALDNSIKTGKTQYTDAFRLTHTNRTTFFNLVDEVRGVI